MIDLGTVRPGSTIRIPFSSFDKDDGSSITMTNYAAADILVYKDGSTTERASTSGYTATTDFDTKTGKHLAIIDLADNTTAGFYAAGSEYLVAIDAVTVDAVTTGGWIARFRIGYPSAILDTTIATLASQTSFTLTAGPAEDDALNGMWCVIHDVASAVQMGKALISDYTGSTKTVTLAAGTTFTAAATDNFSVIDLAPVQPTVTGRTLDVSSTGEAGIDWANIGSPTTAVNLSATNIDTDQVVASVTGAVGSVTGAVGSVTGNVGGNVTGSVGSVTGLTNASIADAVWDEDATAHQTQGTFGQAIGDPGADTDTIFGLLNTNLDATVSSRLASASYSAPPSAASIADAVWDEATAGHASAGTYGLAVSDILTDTAVIGAAGAGLSAIPWNAAWDAEVQSEVDDALAAYDAATGTDVTTAAANVSVDEIQATALADLFNTDSGTTYASAVAGSVVKEIADNAGGSALTAAGIADAVWDEALAGHAGAGSAGEALSAAGTAGDPWLTALPGAYGAGTAGKIIGDNLNATVSSRATQTSVDTIDDFLDTEIAAILADTNELQTDWTNGGRLDLLVDAIKAKTDNLPAAPAATGDIPTAAAVADAVWDEDATAHQTQGTFGQAIGDPGVDTDTIFGLLNTNLDAAVSSRSSQASVDVIDGIVDSILVDTAEIGVAGAGLTNINLPDQTMNITGNLSGSVGSVTGAVGSVTGAVGSVTGNVGGNVTGSVGSLAAQAKADVNAEVVDALATDAYAEPGQGAPAASASVATKIGYLYKAWRNKHTQSADTYSLYADDATTVDQKAAVSDDATTFTRGEVATGP